MHSPTLRPIAILLLALFVISCDRKQAAHDHEHDHATAGEDVWKEMDDFHMIMAETFHPYKDSSNLEPAKAHALELMDAADQWASASLPGKVDNARVRSKLKQLKSEAATLAENVKSSDDNAIAEHLIKVHDTFHAIQEEWYGGH